MTRLLIIFSVLAQICAAQVRPKVAVLDFFNYDNGKRRVLTNIADLIEDELKQRKRFSIVERNQFDGILVDNDIGSLRYCDSLQCVIQSGIMYGVDKVVTGTVRKDGPLHILSVELVDVKTGYPDHIIEIQVKGSFAKAESVGSMKIAAQLSAFIDRKETRLVQKGKSVKEIELEIGSTIDLRVSGSRGIEKSRLLQVGLYTLAAIAGGGGLWYELKVRDDYATYQKLSKQNKNDSDWEDNEEPEYWDQIGDNSSKRNIYYGLAGAFLLMGITYTIAF
ncbi:MAG: hypothetical protein OCD01_12100 [Fibrobacterales bacterium]